MAGCGKDSAGPQTVAATGSVTLDGAPVVGATVFFHPADRNSGVKTGVGETNAEGKFALQTHVQGVDYKSGVVAGDYLVTIEKLEGGERKSAFDPPKDLLPVRYKDPQNSGFTATVAPDQPNEFEFPLKK